MSIMFNRSTFEQPSSSYVYSENYKDCSRFFF